MFRIGELAADMLNSIDNVAKDTLEEPKESAKAIRMKRNKEANSSDSLPLEDGSEPSALQLAPDRSRNKESTTLTTPHSPFFDPDEEPSKPVDKDAKQQLIKKNREIERLNGECLELEGQCEALKGEIREAWEAYKGAQEKAALREAELQDEISEIEKAKTTDRHAITGRFAELETANAKALDTIQTLSEENANLQSQVDELRAAESEWRAREVMVMEELKEAKLNSTQSVKSLRAELQQAESLTEQLRSEHSAWMRQSHKRQEELEEANSELTRSLMSKERELLRAQQSSDRAQREEALQKEIDLLQRTVDKLNGAIGDLQSEHTAVCRRLKQAEYDAETARKAWEAERTMLVERCAQASSGIRSPSATTPTNKDGRVSSTGRMSDGGSSSNGDNTALVIEQLEDQVRNLGQQLLKKQEAMQELLSERAGLKVRLQDAQRRCSRAEEQLAAAADESSSLSALEASAGDVEAGAVSRHGASGASSALQQRRVGGKGKVLGEFERMGVRAGPHVARAVDMIDTWTLLTGSHFGSSDGVR